MNILHVCANPKPTEESISKQIASAFIGKLIELKPEVELVNVDLYDENHPFIVTIFTRELGILFLMRDMSLQKWKRCLNYANGQIESSKRQTCWF